MLLLRKVWGEKKKMLNNIYYVIGMFALIIFAYIIVRLLSSAVFMSYKQVILNEKEKKDNDKET